MSATSALATNLLRHVMRNGCCHDRRVAHYVSAVEVAEGYSEGSPDIEHC